MPKGFRGHNMVLRKLAVFIAMVFSSCFSRMNSDNRYFFLVNANLINWVIFGNSRWLDESSFYIRVLTNEMYSSLNEAIQTTILQSPHTNFLTMALMGHVCRFCLSGWTKQDMIPFLRDAETTPLLSKQAIGVLLLACCLVCFLSKHW